MNNLTVSNVDGYMADGTFPVFIENEITFLQLAAADGTAAGCLRNRGSRYADAIKPVDGLNKA